jgi:hypothetical protein
VHSPRRPVEWLLPGLALVAALAALAAVLLWPTPSAPTTLRPFGPQPVPGGPQVPAPANATHPGLPYDARLAAPTRDNPQSKLWHHDGSWWALLVNSRTDAIHVFELTADHAWRDTGMVVDERQDSTSDVLWDGRQLHVASRTANGSLHYLRASYDQARRGYRVLGGFPRTISDGGMSSVALTRDGRGRSWVSFVRDDTVHVSASDASGLTWLDPYPLPTPEAQVTDDDQADITAFGHGRVGVLWSNQRTGTFTFLSRATADPVTSWAAPETPVRGVGLSDGHVDLTPTSDGRLFAAVKTSRDDISGVEPRDPLVLVLERSADGEWTTHRAGEVADAMTRPRLIISEQARVLYLLSAAPSPGGRIFLKTSPLDQVRWAAGPGRVVMAAEAAVLNHPTSTQQLVDSTTGLVVLASDTETRRYHHVELEVGTVGAVG